VIAAGLLRADIERFLISAVDDRNDLIGESLSPRLETLTRDRDIDVRSRQLSIGNYRGWSLIVLDRLVVADRRYHCRIPVGIVKKGMAKWSRDTTCTVQESSCRYLCGGIRNAYVGDIIDIGSRAETGADDPDIVKVGPLGRGGVLVSVTFVPLSHALFENPNPTAGISTF
jgi:hypothetical protein